MSVPSDKAPAAASGGKDPLGRRRWFILGIIALAQLMVVLDATIVNIALPSAQRALHFSNVDRQWVVTAYALAFGSLLLLGGRLADLFGRKVTFLTGLAGFAVASAVGGASTTFLMLVVARACQGAFGALLAPSALSLLTTTFSDPRERGRAFGVFGAVAGAGGAVGLLLGGFLTQYLSWRWCLYVNLFFAGIALTGGAILLKRQPSPERPRLDLPGVLAVSGGMFCIVYGFSNAASHSWHTPSTWGFLAAGAALLMIFAWWETRAPEPLLPLRIVLDRNRGGAYLSILIAGAGMFGIFLFLTYYMQGTLHYTPLGTGIAFLPMVACIMLSANVSNIVLMPRVGPKPLVGLGMLMAAGAMVWLTRIGVNTSYVTHVLPPILVMGLGLGLVIAPSINTGTFGVAPQDAGVASASVNTGQQLGGSIGTSLLNTVAAGATASYLTVHLAASHLAARPSVPLVQAAQVHGYSTAFWWSAGIFAVGAVVGGGLMRRGPLAAQTGPGDQPAATATGSGETTAAGRTSDRVAGPASDSVAGQASDSVAGPARGGEAGTPT
ncbi:MAG TPA: MFS transporter [Streptosporangiaceae bacterium]|nr:MFS transporter [Streptosporangiaceae bacterium]